MSKIQSRAKYYSLTISMQKSFNQSAQFIKSFVRYTWFKNPTIFKASPTFDNTHPIIIKVTFSFHKFVSAWKKSAQFINSFLRYSRFLESQDPKDYTFYHHDPKIIKVTFGFPEFYQQIKNQFIFFEIQPILVTLDQSGHTHFWPYPPQYFSTNFYFQIICINMQPNQAFSSFCSGDIVNLKILKSQRPFWPISQEPDFSQV